MTSSTDSWAIRALMDSDLNMFSSESVYKVTSAILETGVFPFVTSEIINAPLLFAVFIQSTTFLFVPECEMKNATSLSLSNDADMSCISMSSYTYIWTPTFRNLCCISRPTRRLPPVPIKTTFPAFRILSAANSRSPISSITCVLLRTLISE